MQVNTENRWGTVSRGFHWLMVAIIVVQIPLGFFMVDAYETYKIDYADDTVFMRASMAHNTLGFLFLLLATGRLGWRLSHVVPDLPAALVTYQRYLAKLTHAFFYLLMFAFPLSRWAAL